LAFASFPEFANTCKKFSLLPFDVDVDCEDVIVVVDVTVDDFDGEEVVVGGNGEHVLFFVFVNDGEDIWVF
jgi:hypothetical protein